MGGRRGHLTSAATAVLAALAWQAGAPRALAQDVPVQDPATQGPVIPPNIILELPLVVDGSYRGDLAARLGGDGVLYVDGTRLSSMISGYLTPEAEAELAALPMTEGFVAAPALAPTVTLRLDEATIELKAEVPLGYRRAIGVSATDDPTGRLNTLPPSEFAAAIGLDAGTAYFHEGVTPGLGGTSARLSGWMNIGGADGWFLDAELFYDEDIAEPFRRGDVRLFKDDVARAIRYTIGDLLYTPQGFQTAPRLGGVSVERRYEEIEPSRTVRPTGRTTFTLDRPALVDIVVNGVLFRTARFEPGTYDLQDIPFAEGGNDVQLIIRDDTGRTETVSFSAFSSSSLLADGLSEFGFAAGVESDFGPQGIDYRTEDWAVTGYWRQAVSESLTAGLNAQVGPGAYQVGAEAVYGVGEFLTVARLSGSNRDDVGSGYAAEGAIQWRPSGEGWINGFSADVTARYVSENFGGIGPTPFENPYEWDVTARLAFPLPFDANASLSYSRQFAREIPDPDVTRWSATVSKRFGPVSVFATFDRRELGLFGDEDRFTVSLNYALPWGATYARGGYDSTRSATRLELQRLPRPIVGDLSGSLVVEDSDQGQELFGGARYRDNRFIAGVDHSLVYSDVNSEVVRSVSRANIRTGLAYADGTFGVGPTVGDGGFAMVRRGRGLTQGKVLLNPTDDGAQSAADAFGPGVIGGLRGYAPGRVQVMVDTDQPGFENASAIFNLLPSARSGYVFTVGETAEVTLVARLVGADGAPLSLSTGRIVSLDREGVESIVFTNRDGRYVGEGLGAGTWRIEMPQGTATFTLTEDQVGIVRLPDLVITSERTP